MNNLFHTNDVFDSNILSDLRANEGLIYLAYLRYSNGGRDVAYPSQAHLAWSLGVDTKTIGRAVKVLKKKGFIVQVRSGKGGQSTKASEYTVNTPAQLGYVTKKSATQAPSPPAPVPAPAKQTKPQPAPAAAPAPTPVVPVTSPAPIPQPASILTPDQIQQLRELHWSFNLNNPSMIEEYPNANSLILYVESMVKRNTSFDSILSDLEAKASGSIEEEVPF